MVHTVESIIPTCERFKLASLGSDGEDVSSMRKVWRALSSKVRAILESGKTAVIPGFARFGLNSATGEGVFGLAPSFVSCHGVRFAQPRHCKQGPDVKVTAADLSISSGVGRDGVQVAVKELIDKFGEVGGRRGEATRVRLDGVGTLTFRASKAGFVFDSLPKPRATAPATRRAPTNQTAPYLRKLVSKGSRSALRSAAVGTLSNSASRTGPTSPSRLARTGSRSLMSARSTPSVVSLQPPTATATAGATATATATSAPYSGPATPSALFSPSATTASSYQAPLIPPARVREGKGPAKAITGPEALEHNLRVAEAKRQQAVLERERTIKSDASFVKDQRRMMKTMERSEKARREREQAYFQEQRAEAEKLYAESRRRPGPGSADENSRWVFSKEEEITEKNQRLAKELQAGLDAQLRESGHAAVKPKRLGSDGGIAPHGPHYPTFLRPEPQQTGVANASNALAAKLVQKQAERRLKDEMRGLKAQIKKKEAEVKAVVDKGNALDAEKARKARALQMKQNADLEGQLRAREAKRAAEKAAHAAEPLPDHSHVHPVFPHTNPEKEKAKKEGLKAALDVQIRLKRERETRLREMERLQDDVFLESVFQEIHDESRGVKTKATTKAKQLKDWDKQKNSLARSRKLAEKLIV